MPLFARSRKAWPIVVEIVLLVVVIASLEALGAHRLSSYILFFVVLVAGGAWVVEILKDIFLPK